MDAPRMERRGGPRPGTGAKPGERRGGRQKGTPNKTTADIRALAQQHGPKAIEALVEAMTKGEMKVRVMAAKEILDRGYGRSTLYVATPEEEPIVAKVSAVDEFARRISRLAAAARETKAAE